MNKSSNIILAFLAVSAAYGAHSAPVSAQMPYKCNLAYTIPQGSRSADTVGFSVDFIMKNGVPDRNSAKVRIDWKMTEPPGYLYLATSVTGPLYEKVSDPKEILIHFPTGEVRPEDTELAIGTTETPMKLTSVATREYRRPPSGNVRQNEIVGAIALPKLQLAMRETANVYVLNSRSDGKGGKYYVTDIVGREMLHRMNLSIADAYERARSFLTVNIGLCDPVKS